ncbi:MAG: T9SS type A sorting domain-containing protein [Ignavibacteria bacterium]|nr:T9SS type A sorting domain-containing protein [Ignavibacteria bacterium]
MRNIIQKFLFILFALIFSSVVYSQAVFNHWNPVNSPVTENLNSVLYYYQDNIFAFGNNGSFIKSTNAGYNWNIIILGTQSDLYSSHISNSILVSGENGTVLRSTNSGLNWLSIGPQISQSLYGISQFYSGTSFIICGENGIVYYTTNQGANWVQQNTGTTNNLRSVFYSNSVSLYRSYLCGDNGTLVKFVLTIPPVPAIISFVPLQSGFTNNLNCIIAVSDTNTLMAAGSNGIIIKSINGGLNWVQQQSGTTNSLRKIYQVSPNEFWISGDNGTMLHTTNGGTNWILQTVNSASNINSLTFTSNTKGIAVGSGGTILNCELYPSPSDSAMKWTTLDGNNICSYFWTTGIMNQHPTMINTPGFEWPKGSNKYAIFTSGLSIAGYVNGVLKEAMVSYKGELWQGFINNGVPETPVYMKRIYKVRQGDNCYNSVDWANWGLMVPYGAPFRDVNNNGVYDMCIDTPGVRNASQTLFMALTDGYPWKHSPGEGFGGGTLPLYADFRITAWCYSDSIVQDVQFIKYVVINKSNSVWDSTIFSLVGDADLGDANDDYVGMDSLRNLWYLYNADNNDPVYGTNPPAVGMRMIRFPVKKNVTPHDTIKASSGVQFSCTGCGTPPCETTPNGEPLGAYNFMKGYKKDLSPWMNPVFMPPAPTKFIYSGEPEFASGWTEYKGCVFNCGGPNGQILAVVPPGDRRYLLNAGAPDFKVFPGDTQTVVIGQMIARGSSNLNSVTKLKQLSDIVVNFYQTVDIKQISTEVPETFYLLQNYPNPFNSMTNIKFEIPNAGNVKIKVFDVTGKEVSILVNENLQAGTYEVRFNAGDLPSGIYFYSLIVDDIFISTKKFVLVK